MVFSPPVAFTIFVVFPTVTVIFPCASAGRVTVTVRSPPATASLTFTVILPETLVALNVVDASLPKYLSSPK